VDIEPADRDAGSERINGCVHGAEQCRPEYNRLYFGNQHPRSDEDRQGDGVDYACGECDGQSDGASFGSGSKPAIFGGGIGNFGSICNVVDTTGGGHDIGIGLVHGAGDDQFGADGYRNSGVRKQRQQVRDGDYCVTARIRQSDARINDTWAERYDFIYRHGNQHKQYGCRLVIESGSGNDQRDRRLYRAGNGHGGTDGNGFGF
jgi:hypothetical protein